MNNAIDYIKIGKRIKDMRKERGITQETICNKLNISLYHYSKIENGKVSASLETLVEIANYFDIEIETLLTGCSALHKSYLEEELESIFNKCNNHQKRMIIEIAKVIAKSDVKNYSQYK